MKTTIWAVAAATAVMLCAPAANADGVIDGNSGAYMSPFTSDGVTAGWITKSLAVKNTAALGGVAGSYAAQKVLENVPFAGMFGKQAGQQVGRAIALKAIGGEAFLKSSSDLSFANLQDMAQYVKDNYADRADIGQIMQAAYAIYPDLQAVYDVTGRHVAVGKPIKAVAAANSSGIVSDLYVISSKGAETVTVAVEAEEMEPLVMVTAKGTTKIIASAQAPKGAKSVSVQAALPAAGDYAVSVQPAPKLFGGGKAGAYTLTISSSTAKLASLAQ